MVLYRDACTQAASFPNNPNYRAKVSDSAEKLASTLKEAADLHPDPSVGREWRRQADEFVKSSGKERENALEEIGKGLLKVIVAPLALAGLGIYAAGEIVTGVGRATGEILTGVGSLLKGIGKLGKVALLGE